MGDIINVTTDGSESTVEVKLKALRRELGEQRAISEALSLFPTKALEVDHVDSVRLTPVGEEFGLDIAHSYKVLVILNLNDKQDDTIDLTRSEEVTAADMTSVPRTVEHYERTAHARTQFISRGIDMQTLRQAINDGTLHNQDTFPSERLGMRLENPNLIAFELELPMSFFVLADPMKGDIVTMFYEENVDSVQPGEW